MRLGFELRNRVRPAPQPGQAGAPARPPGTLAADHLLYGLVLSPTARPAKLTITPVPDGRRVRSQMISAVKRSIISAAWQMLTGELDREVGRNYLAGRDPGRLAAQHVHLPGVRVGPFARTRVLARVAAGEGVTNLVHRVLSGAFGLVDAALVLEVPVSVRSLSGDPR